jgi:hypothetical protein
VPAVHLNSSVYAYQVSSKHALTSMRHQVLCHASSPKCLASKKKFNQNALFQYHAISGLIGQLPFLSSYPIRSPVPGSETVFVIAYERRTRIRERWGLSFESQMRFDSMPRYVMCQAALPKAPVRVAFAASGREERHCGAPQSADDVALASR